MSINNVFNIDNDTINIFIMFLLRFIIFFIIIYFIFLSIRYIVPFLIKHFIKRSENKFYKQNRDFKRKKQGEVSIDYVPEKEKEKENKNKKDSDLGEYIDYEDIDN